MSLQACRAEAHQIIGILSCCQKKAGHWRHCTKKWFTSWRKVKWPLLWWARPITIEVFAGGFFCISWGGKTISIAKYSQTHKHSQTHTHTRIYIYKYCHGQDDRWRIGHFSHHQDNSNAMSNTASGKSLAAERAEADGMPLMTSVAARWPDWYAPWTVAAKSGLVCSLVQKRWSC